MLRVLRIRNLAIIDSVEVDFREGFNVLTGETGAGKSILLGALNLLLGERASTDMIRTGKDEAKVEALFDLPEDFLIPPDVDESLLESGEVILARRISRTGRSRCFINGNLATVGMLRSVGRALVTIFGQHEHQVLLNPGEHVDLLDGFGGLKELRQKCEEAFRTMQKAKGALNKARSKLEKLEREAKDNAEAVEELTEARLLENEEDELERERDILRKAAQIREKASWAHNALYARSGSILENLAEVRKAVDWLASANPKLAPIKENVDGIVYAVEDVAMELRSTAEDARGDPHRLESIEDRLALIRRLKRKYGADVPGLIRLLETMNNEAGDVLNARSELRKVEQRLKESRNIYLAAAHDLSDARRRAAKELETAMKTELAELAMPQATFQVQFRNLDEENGRAGGLEEVEFLLSANPGEAPRPLSRIASGGELSRIMLALKALQVEDRPQATIIFDEVDAGIGGRTALAVAERLVAASERRQVICVTHLHQLAARANHHLSVAKSVKKKRTQLSVTALDDEKRVEELARMLGAPPASESARDQVKRLMDLGSAEVSG